MKLKKYILFLLLLLLPYSCVTLKKTNKYPINSAWYYDDGDHRIIVYIDRISIIEGILIRDTKVRNDSMVFGRVNRKYLYPIVIVD